MQNGARDVGSLEGLAHSKSYYVPKIMVTNDMSVVPKMSEVCEFLLRNKVSPAFMTETWLQSSIAVSIIDIPGYSVHGGVCLYINAEIRYKRLNALSCYPDHEVLWVQLRPKRLPRGFSSLIVAVVCHPHWSAAENEFMQEHLFQSLQLVESRFHDCALIVAGDFNRFDTRPIERHFRLKQIVKIPTRKDAMLDRVLTNLHRVSVPSQGVPPFGLSDHNTITAEAKVRDNSRHQSRFVFKRDKRESREAELGRYLCAIDWTMLFSSANCRQEMLDIFNKVLHTGLDFLMPFRKVCVNTSDATWMNDHLKSLILKRQKAFHDGGTDQCCTNSTGML